MEFHPENKISHFKTQLPKCISFKDEWEVGLVEIHYPCSFSIIEQKELLFLYQGWSETYLKEPRPNLNTLKEETVFLRESPDFTSIQDLVDYLQTHPDVTPIFDISLRENKIEIKLQERIVKLKLSRGLENIFGLSDTMIAQTVQGRPVNERTLYPSQMYVYCDLVHPQLVGDVFAPLLRIVNVDTSRYLSDTHGVEIFTHPHYVPLVKREFQSVEIDIRRHLGTYLPFVRGQLNVKLHFRRVV